MAFDNVQPLIEKRQFQRVAHDARALVVSGDLQLESRALDVSLKGCLLALPTGVRLESGPHYQITLQLGPEVTIRMESSLAHQEQDHAGFACREIDLDSVTALRRLVELNLGDSKLLDRELNALIHAA